MAVDVSGSRGGSSSRRRLRWQDEADPELRPLVVKQLEATMAGLCRALHKDRSPPKDLNQYVADFEEITFETAKDMIDYMKMISIRVSFGQKEVQVKAAAYRQQKMQMVHQMQMANMVQAIQGVNNSSLTTTPQAVPMTDSPSLPPFQSPNQHTACAVASNMNSNLNQGPPDMTAMLYQNFNSEQGGAETPAAKTPASLADQAKDQEHGGAETPAAKTPASLADQAKDQEHGGAETPAAKTPASLADQAKDQEHGRAETPAAKMPASLADQAKDQEHGGAETPVAKKPIDRLIAAVRSSSPAAIRSSFNLMKSAVIDMDSVALPIGPNNKMKRVYAVTSTSESPTLSSTDGSTVTSEFNASDSASSGHHIGKRQKPQNAKMLCWMRSKLSTAD